MTSDLTTHQAADALLRALRPELKEPSAATGCAVTELVNAALRVPEDQLDLLSVLSDIAFGLGLQLSQLDPATRGGVLRMLKNRMNDGALRAVAQAGSAVH